MTQNLANVKFILNAKILANVLNIKFKYKTF